MMKLMKIISKLCLSSAQQLRVLNACTIEAFMINAKCPLRRNIAAVVEKYVEKAAEFSNAQQAGKEASIGLIHH